MKQMDFNYRGHCIYVMSAGPFVKIGYSIDPKRRIKAIQNANPHEVLFEFVGPPLEWRDAWAVEQACHGILGKHRVRGEWFSCSVDEAVNTIKSDLRIVGYEQVAA